MSSVSPDPTLSSAAPQRGRRGALLTVSEWATIGDMLQVRTRRDQGWVDVRTIDNPSAVLTFFADEWRAFVLGVKAGEFDLESD